MDAIAWVAAASKDEVWAHLSMIWIGPLDDIFYFVVACQALFYLVDPTGQKTQDSKGAYSAQGLYRLVSGGNGVDRVFSGGFLRGARLALLFLPITLIGAQSLKVFFPTAMSTGLANVLYWHVSLTFPVYLIVGLCLTSLGLNSLGGSYWKATLLGWLALALMIASDNRWDNHLYHLLTNVESLQAWSVSLSWAGFFAARAAITPELQDSALAST